MLYNINSALYVIFRPEQRFFFIYDQCLLQDQDDDITRSVLYFDPKLVSSLSTSGFIITCNVVFIFCADIIFGSLRFWAAIYAHL